MPNSVFKPHRGKKSTMEEKHIILEKGELFIETPEDGFGSESGKIKIGDGITPYEDLPYFVETGATEEQGAKADTAVQDVKIGGVSYKSGNNVDLPTSMPASDVYEWAKQATKPEYTADEVGAIDIDDKGVANGVATLDENGRIPYNQLPESSMELKGVWNASTNTPTLTQGVGVNGDFYIVEVGGTWSGITFTANDRIIFVGNDTNRWMKLAAGDVSSVNGRNGAVVLTKADVELSNVDNTSDLNKPISTATQNALDNKVSDVQVDGVSIQDTNNIVNIITATDEQIEDLFSEEIPVTPEHSLSLYVNDNNKLFASWMNDEEQTVLNISDNNGRIIHHYSTEEHIIGTWTNNYPLYEKTFINISLGDSTTVQVADLIDYDIKDVIAFEGYCYTNSGVYQPLETISSYVNISNYKLTITTYKDYTNYQAAVTIRYTKNNGGSVVPIDPTEELDLESTDTIIDIRSDITELQNNIGMKRKFEKVMFDYNSMWNTDDETARTNAVEKYKKFDVVISGLGNRYDPTAMTTAASRMTAFLEQLRSEADTKVFNYIELGNRAGQDQCFAEYVIKSYIHYTAHIGGVFTGEDEDGTRHYENGIAMDGIFFDECEYPFGVSRNRMNLSFETSHEEGLIAFPNCYSPEISLFSTDTTATLPNGQLANPDGLEPSIIDGDYLLLESCFTTAGSTSTIMVDGSSWKRAYNFNQTYRSQYPGLKVIPLNYISSVTVLGDADTLQRTRSYCIMMSFFNGMDGCAIQVGQTYTEAASTWELPDIIKSSLTLEYPLIRTVSADYYRMESGGHIFDLNMDLINADDSHIDLSENIWDHVYFKIDGAKIDTCWTSVFSILNEVREIVENIDVEYNNDSTKIQKIGNAPFAGIESYAARADHVHQAGPYLYIKKDEWDKTYTNYFGNYSRFTKSRCNGNITMQADGFCTVEFSSIADTSGQGGLIFWFDNGKLNDLGLGGHYLEFGFQSLEGIELTTTDTYDSSIDGSIAFRVTNTSHGYGTTTSTAWGNVGDTLVKSHKVPSKTYLSNASCVIIYIPKAYNSNDNTISFTFVPYCSEVPPAGSYKIKGVYLRDIGELNPYYTICETPTNAFTADHAFFNFTNIDILNGNRKGKITYIDGSSSGAWWTIYLGDVKDLSIYRGKTLEFGIKINPNTSTGAYNNVCFRFMIGTTEVRFFLNNTYYNAGLKDGYYAGRYNVPSDIGVVPAYLHLTRCTNGWDIEGMVIDVEDYYVYDLSEDIPDDDDRMSNTTIKVDRLDNIIPTTTTEKNTVYMAPNIIGITDPQNNMNYYRSGSIVMNGTEVYVSGGSVISTIPADKIILSGDMYINTSTGSMFRYDGTEWTIINISGGHNYSTTDQVVGTWIDGKPIYENTYHIVPTGNDEYTTNDFYINDLDKVIKTEFIAKRVFSTYTQYYTGNGSNMPEDPRYIEQYKLGIRISQSYIQHLIAGYDTEITDMWATVQYTKTTD